MKTASCTKCDRTFTKSTQMLADQALRMHVGRKHDRNIVADHEHSGVVRQRRNGSLVAVAASRNHLTDEEKNAVVGFIRDRKNDYPTKQACFSAALEAAGARDKITSNSTAVMRYFQKADSDKPTRTYTRRQKQQTPVEHHVHINFCPNCGCNIHQIATGIAMAQLTR